MQLCERGIGIDIAHAPRGACNLSLQFVVERLMHRVGPHRD
jgi:hypothetical protein